MKLLFISLGCDKNLVDTEKMLGILRDAGYEFTEDETEAEIIIVNTCCFIGDAKEESINTILEMAEYKKTAVCKALIVTGCLAERYKEEVQKEIPEVDGVLGIASYGEIAAVVKEALAHHHPHVLLPNNEMPMTRKRNVPTGGYYAFLRIAEGFVKK